MASNLNAKRKRQQRQIDFAIDRIESAVEQQLALLNAHRLKLNKHRKERDLHALHLEQLEAASCIKRLNNVLRELESLTHSTPEQELGYLTAKTERLAKRINGQIESIAAEVENLHDGAQQQPPLSQMVSQINEPNEEQVNQSDINEHMSQENLMLEEEISERRGVLKSYQRLSRDLFDLNNTINNLSGLILHQGETVDRIDNNITNAHENVRRGAIQLASIKKAAGLPLLCAGVGTILAGPIGLIAGAKIGLVAALGTATIGYSGGKMVQRYANAPDPLMIEDRPAHDKPDDDSGGDKRTTDE